MFRLLLTLLFLANFSLIEAQVYRNLTTANGLKNNNVYSIARDKEGFLWFLSSNGVDRFDGLDFIHFKLNTKNRPIGLKPMSQLVSDNDGDIWQVGTTIGDSIAHFDRSRGQFCYTQIVGASSDHGLRYLFIDTKNRIWISSGTKLFIYDIENKKQIDIDINLTSDIVCGAELNNGSFAIGMKKGVMVINSEGNQWSFKQLNCGINIIEHMEDVQNMQTIIPANLNDLSTHKIVVCNDKNFDMLVFDTQSRIYRVDIDKDFAKVCIVKKIYDTHITDIKHFFDDKNKLFIATEGRGVLTYDIEKCKAEEYLRYYFDDMPGLKGNVVMSVLPDPSKKRVWLANHPYGVLCYNFDFPTYRHFSHEKGNANTIGAGVVTAITEDSEGDIWFATSSGVSCYFKKIKKWKHYLTDENRKNLTYLAVCEIRPGIILATGLMSGAFVIDKRTNKVEHITPHTFGSDNTPDRGIRSVYTDDNGIIWIAGEEVLVRLDWDNKTYSSTPLASQAMAIKKRDENNFWLVTLNGLYSVNINSGKKTKYKLPENCIDINDVLSTTNGDLFVATTDEGLFIKKSGNDSFKQYIHQNSGLLSNNILALVEDDSCNVVMSTDQGMTRYYPEKDAFINWSHWQGMVSHGFYKMSACHTSDKVSLFGTNNGFVELSDSIRMPRVLNSDIILFNLYINGKLQNASNDFQQLDLKYNQRQIEFTIGNLNFDNPFSINYTWKLEGTRDQWRPASKNRRIAYLLTPGNYKLMIRAINGANHTIIEERTINIHVAQPWYFSLPANIIYVLLTIAAIYGIYIFTKLRNKRLMAEDKVKFFIQTAHEIRTPLTLIKAPLEEISRNEILSERGDQNIQTALKSANDLLILSGDLLNLERQKIKENKLHLTHTNLTMYLQELIIPFQLYARTKKLDLVFNSTTNGKVWIDRSRLDSIMQNLINNALKYTNSGGSITVNANISENYWSVSISDTGIGIPKEEEKKLATIFYRSTNAEISEIKGSGMGLYLVKRLVEEHMGNMTFVSEKDKGTTFTLTFPIDYEKQKNVVKTTLKGCDNNTKRDLPNLLVVEDNIDMREFITSSLCEFYNIYTSENGVEAYNKIRFLHPDIVVSDVMMPEMRGDELCRKIKSEIETSHIPVILLTALADKDSVIEGLSTLADSYLTKPFSISILKAQIDNILSNRQSLQKFYSSVAISPSDNLDENAKANNGYEDDAMVLEANQIDIKFINNVNAIVDKHMSENEFNVDILCTYIGMSRTSFYNKLKSLTGEPPADYIRNRKIEKAKMMLLKTNFTITEISEKCGFYEAKYFREVFKKNVGVSPKQYRNEEREKQTHKKEQE
ncbi:MAG: response regulator [Bacteroidaceae bacterium]|nr:response regulator [Bacteroidaceae bacterium]